MKQLLKIVALSALTFGGFASAYADTILAPGTSISPAALAPSSSAVQLQYEIGTASAFFKDGGLDYTVTYQAWVYSDPTNSLCANCLDFAYVFANDGPGINERFSMSNFTGFATDAGVYNVNQNPGFINRSSDGSTIGFNYLTTNLASGQTTSFFLIETNATNYQAGTFTVQDGATVDIAGWAPSSAPAVPEPSSLALLGTGVLGVAGMIRRKLAA